ncbi:MAG: hypothetical protein WCZ23_01410, partial [Rhodospirillaceae bacterium]
MLAACLILMFASGAAQATTAPDKALSERDRTIYQRAFQSAERGQWAAALQTATQAENPILRDVLTWRHMQDSASPYSFTEITEFLTKHPDWPSQAALRRRAGDALSDSHPADQVIAWYSANPPFTGRGKMLLADAMLSKGRDSDAMQVARSAWVNNTFNR